MTIYSTAEAFKKALDKALDKTTPILKKGIKKELLQIEKKAQSNWPTRQEKYGDSKGSKGKIAAAIKSTNKSVTGSISNKAEYAWAIKAGTGSNTTVPPGKRVAEELIYKPIKKAADRLARQVADELMHKIRRL